MSFQEAMKKYAAYGVDVEGAMARLKTVPVSLQCWQGDDVRGFDTDPTKPLTGGIQAFRLPLHFNGDKPVGKLL